MDQVLSVIPNQYHKLDTTRSWDFIGLPQIVERNLVTERDIVVGLLDSGSWILFLIQFYGFSFVFNFFLKRKNFISKPVCNYLLLFYYVAIKEIIYV